MSERKQYHSAESWLPGDECNNSELQAESSFAAPAGSAESTKYDVVEDKEQLDILATEIYWHCEHGRMLEARKLLNGVYREGLKDGSMQPNDQALPRGGAKKGNEHAQD